MLRGKELYQTPQDLGRQLRFDINKIVNNPIEPPKNCSTDHITSEVFEIIDKPVLFLKQASIDLIRDRLKFLGTNEELCDKLYGFKSQTIIKSDKHDKDIVLWTPSIAYIPTNEDEHEYPFGYKMYCFVAAAFNDLRFDKKSFVMKVKGAKNPISFSVGGRFFARPKDSYTVKLSDVDENNFYNKR